MFKAPWYTVQDNVIKWKQFLSLKMLLSRGGVRRLIKRIYE